MRPLTDLPLDAFVGLHVWITPPATGLRESTISSVRPGPKGPLLSMSGVDDLGTASMIAGKTLVARPEDLPVALSEEEPDPVGLAIRDLTRGDLGIVTDVIVTGANDVWVVEGETYGEVLIPIIDDVLLDVDFDENRATVRLLRGLIDGEDDL